MVVVADVTISTGIEGRFAAMFTATSSNKRRRILEHCPLHDLLQGGGLLEEVAKYLAPPSKIMFALAVTPPKSPYGTIMARSRSKSRSTPFMITGTDEWNTLDFGEIEKDLAAKLSDNDMCAILVHIDAARKVKRLKLTNCTNITGVGLMPLQFSTVIEQIDLSLVGMHQSPELDPEPLISCELVLPILQSIINENRCALKHLEFPKVWRKYNSADGTHGTAELTQFIEQYNEMMENRGLASCSKCDETLEHHRHNIIEYCDEEQDYGTQLATCHQCLKYYCTNCREEDNYSYLNYCYTCQRRYCKDCCTTRAGCGSCSSKFCPGCLPYNCANPDCMVEMCGYCYEEEYGPCEECNKTWCYSCGEDDTVGSVKHCHTCYRRERGQRKCCRECSQKEGVNGVHRCVSCRSQNCDECRIIECHNGNNKCSSCLQMVNALLFKKVVQLENRNRFLETQVETLKDLQPSLARYVETISRHHIRERERGKLLEVMVTGNNNKTN